MFVVTADQRDSRANADLVPSALAVVNGHGTTALALSPERTAGDELQVAIADPTTVLSVVLELTRTGQWSVGVGVGDVEAPLPASVRAARGEAFVVTNGDVLAKADYGHVLDSHLESGAVATVVVRDYQMQVPFGVVNADREQILAIEEKPIQSYTISAGAYVLSPSALRKVPADAYYDMPSLIADLIGGGMSVRQQRAEGYWMDIGRPPDYAQANADFRAVFET